MVDIAGLLEEERHKFVAEEVDVLGNCVEERN